MNQWTLLKKCFVMLHMQREIIHFKVQRVKGDGYAIIGMVQHVFTSPESAVNFPPS